MDMFSKIFGFSYIGHRKENQDRYKVLSAKKTKELLIVVADGMGGHKGGSIAAEAAVNSVEESWSNRTNTQDIDQFLTDLVLSAHKAVNLAGEQAGLVPKTTLSVLYVYGHKAKSIHVGDSRIIQIDKHNSIKRTNDHSLAQILLVQGKISEDELASHPDQNKLFTSVGGDEDPEYEIENWDPDNSFFIVCSDGFWELFSQAELKAELVQINSKEKLEKLILARINQTTKHDNTTGVLVDLRIKKTSGLSVTFLGVLALLFILLGFIAFYIFSDNQIDSSKNTTDINEETNPDVNAEINNNENSGGNEVIDNSEVSSSSENSENNSEITGSENTEIFPETSKNEDGGLYPDGPKSSELEINQSEPFDISTKRRKVNVPVDSSEDAISKTEEILKGEGDLGPDDNLKPKNKPKNIGNSKVIKLQQVYKGIPVYGAETIVIVNGGTVSEIDGKSVSDINIDVNPELTYSEVISKASKELDETLTPEDEGKLVIYKNLDNYILAWIGTVITSTDIEEVIFDSSNAQILIRYSTVFKNM